MVVASKGGKKDGKKDKEGKGKKKAGSEKVASNAPIPIDASSVLPDGPRVDGLGDLKAYLLKNRRDDFAEAFVTKLLSYSVGRSPELGDEHDIEELTTAFGANDYRMKPLIKAVINSQAFQTK